MSFKMCEKQAEALCTVIAAGFVLKNHSAVLSTKFVYDSTRDKIVGETKGKHALLVEKLKKCGIPIAFSEQQQSHPLIMAKTSYIYNNAVIQGIADEFNRICNDLETSVNTSYRAEYREKYGADVPPIPGAYIGGRMDLNTFLISGPSYLYLTDPTYRNVDSKIENSYNAAKAASNALVNYLKSKSHKEPLRFPDADKCLIKEDYQSGKLFASCHGMIIAMNEVGLYNDKWAACVELALGAETCKVASCLPCSLFMSANDTPATATHFGRGDNWNLPKTGTQDIMKNKWKKMVNDAYELGISKPAIKDIPDVIEFSEYIEREGLAGKIPEIFLEALTFEGSFIDKINNTIT